MQSETTGEAHASAASGGGGWCMLRCSTAAVEKQPMTVGDTMMQQRPHADAHTSLHLHGEHGGGVIVEEDGGKKHLHRSGDESTPFVRKRGTGWASDDDAPANA
jgi:hypothetical protein